MKYFGATQANRSSRSVAVARLISGISPLDGNVGRHGERSRSYSGGSARSFHPLDGVAALAMTIPSHGDKLYGVVSVMLGELRGELKIASETVIGPVSDMKICIGV